MASVTDSRTTRAGGSDPRAADRPDTPADPQADTASRPGPGDAGSSWIFSAPLDLLVFLGPILLSALLLPILAGAEREHTPLWAYVGFVVAVDVAHVWATLFRTYLDTAELRRRPALYTLPIPIILIISFLLFRQGSWLFWTAAAYFAIFHFIRQDYGFLALYRHRAGETELIDRRLDALALTAGALGPVLLWHASPSRRFDWFGAGERFLFGQGGLSPALRPIILGLWGLAAALWLGRLIQRARAGRPVSRGKVLFMVLVHLRWSIGSLFDHPLVSLAFINLFHGLPFVALVWRCVERGWREREPETWSERLLSSLALSRRWWIYLIILIALALGEELTWEVLVWRDYLPADAALALPELGRNGTALAVSVLALPQLLHYFLDGFIWKMDGSNPGLREWLLTPDPA